MPKTLIDTEPFKDALPEICFLAITTEPNCLVAITRGEIGYRKTTYPRETLIRNNMNKRLGVTAAQLLAMTIGSMSGWNVPGANPANHTKFLREKGLTAFTDKLDF